MFSMMVNEYEPVYVTKMIITCTLIYKLDISQLYNIVNDKILAG